MDEYIPKREPLPAPRRVRHPTMTNWGRQDTSNWANQGAKPKGQIIIQAEYEGAVLEASVMKGTCYSLCALRSRVRSYEEYMNVHAICHKRYVVNTLP